MKILLIVVLLFIGFNAYSDDQAPLYVDKEVVPAYRMGDWVVIKIPVFYTKVCRDLRIPGFELLAKDETVGQVVKHYSGTYSVAFVSCIHRSVEREKTFKVIESNIVRIYTLPEKEEEGWWSWWYLLSVPALALGIPLI